MSEWKRVTKEVAFEALPSEMASAINRHIERYNLGTILEDALMCIQTDSEKAKKGFFGTAESVRMDAIVTPRWLIWAIGGAQTQASAHSAQLINVVVQDYSQTPFAQMVPDSGVQVSGMFTDAAESASAFIGLDESPAGKKFREVLITAAQNAKK